MAYVAIGFLIVCSLLATSLTVLDLGSLFGGDRDIEEFDAGAGNEFIEELRSDVADNPTDATKMSQLAELLFYDGNVSESIVWYQRALDLEPDNSAIRLSFAETLAEADIRNDAELQYQIVLRAEPNNDEAHYGLAELYRFWDPPRDDEAAEHYLRVIAISPEAYLAEQSAIQLAALGYATPTSFASPETAAESSSPAATEGGS